MKKQRNHCQLKDQENFPERTVEQTSSVWQDTQFKKETEKRLKESIMSTDRTSW